MCTAVSSYNMPCLGFPYCKWGLVPLLTHRIALRIERNRTERLARCQHAAPVRGSPEGATAHHCDVPIPHRDNSAAGISCCHDSTGRPLKQRDPQARTWREAGRRQRPRSEERTRAVRVQTRSCRRLGGNVERDEFSIHARKARA